MAHIIDLARTKRGFHQACVICLECGKTLYTTLDHFTPHAAEDEAREALALIKAGSARA